MKAMVFAAGVGSRLKPITNNIPKALVEVNGKTLLQHTLEYLKEYGVTEAIINIHHFGKQIINFCASRNFGIDITFSDERKLLLDTGGGLKKASNYFSDNDPFIVVNADILTNVNINNMLTQHLANKSFVTLAVRDRSSSRKLLFNKDNELCAWKNTVSNELVKVKSSKEVKEYAFSGLHIISPAIFCEFPNQDVFSIIEFYLELAGKYRINAFIHNDSYWFDVGTIEKLEIVEQFFKN